ncbi:MAG: hypothetical protein N2490_08935 [Ignavibacteria bacterium]|nr:hypothetical protein [Ignavibacteria bacterium]
MWKNIYGHKKVIETLKKIYKSKKIANAYIFFGPEGIGKDAMAIEFAKLINCDNVDDEIEACDRCASCKQTQSLYSSLFKIITALPAGSSDNKKDSDPINNLSKSDYEYYLTELDEKRKNPYHRINIPGANFIRIDSIRQLKNDIYLKGIKGKKKIYLISRADMMNIESYNSLLKILEEPPGDSLLILTTSRINSLPATIIGRCQKIKFNPLGINEIEDYLRNIRHDFTEEEIKFYSRLSEGSIVKLLNLLNTNYVELRDNIVDMLRNIITSSYISLSNEIKKIIENKDKDRIKYILQILQLWFRDVIYVTNGKNEYVINIDRIDVLEKFSKNIKSNCYKIINFLEDSLRDIEININPELALNKLFFNLKGELERVKS